MSPITHFLLGWCVASTADLNKRERAVVALAGVAPDLDGLGIVADFATRGSAQPLNWWGEYHHVVGHNIGFAFTVVCLAAILAHKRWLAAGLASASFHLHLLCDIIGSRGPDGYQWPIPYLLPFSNAVQFTWTGQWPLNGWQNMLITAAALAVTLWLAWKRGFSPLEIVSRRADAAVVGALRHRFGQPAYSERKTHGCR